MLANVFEGNPFRSGVIKYHVVLISRSLLTVFRPGRDRKAEKGHLFLQLHQGFEIQLSGDSWVIRSEEESRYGLWKNSNLFRREESEALEMSESSVVKVGETQLQVLLGEHFESRK